MSEKKEISVKEEARQAIVAGGSYLLKVNGTSTLFTADNIDQFPSDADLALGNPAAETAALDDIEAQMEKLAEAKKKLQAAKRAEAKEDDKEEESKPRAAASEPKEADKKEADKKEADKK